MLPKYGVVHDAAKVQSGQWCFQSTEWAMMLPKYGVGHDAACSLPLWRVHEIKRMYPAPCTHGLFITETQFRLLTMYIQTFRQLLYTCIQINNIIMAQSPCFTPLTNSLLLTWKPSFGVIRSRPPWPQVTRKLTSPFSSPPQSLPIPNSRPPGVFLS